MTIDWKGWKPYLCRVNDKPASILVNLGLRDAAPIQSKPWLLWTWVYFQSPRPDGLSSGSEAPTLYEIEDALYAKVSELCGAQPCGRITTEGRREFYFYGETDNGFPKAIKLALSAFEKYKFDIGAKSDPSWHQYINVLYPSPQDLQRIANTDLLDVLARQGDVHSVPREVQHWLYFPSCEACSSFRDAAIDAGFNIASEKVSETELPFTISLVRVQPIDKESIDATAIQLLDLSQGFEGEYDGWETRVVTQ